MYGCPEKFRESSLCTRLLLLLFRSILRMCVQNLKFVALPVPEIMGYSKNFASPWIHPRSIFSQIFKRLLFACTHWIHLPNLKFVALPIPEIIGGTQKIWTVPGCAHAPFSSKFLKGFYSDGPVNIPAKFEVRSFIPSWDNRGYSKNLGSPCIRHAPFSPKFLIGFCSHGPSEYICQIWSS